MPDFRQDLIRQANEPRIDEVDIASKAEIVLDGQNLDVMMRSHGGKLLQRYLTKHLNLDSLITQSDDKLIKTAHEMNALRKLREYIVTTIEAKNKLEGEKNE